MGQSCCASDPSQEQLINTDSKKKNKKDKKSQQTAKAVKKKADDHKNETMFAENVAKDEAKTVEDSTNTSWTVSISDDNATLSYTTNTSPNNPTAFTIKGICYSPCPIGNANTLGPNIGDWFWDSFKTSNGVQIWNWSRYWDTNRHDLDNIKSIGANTIRVYCMLSYQLNGNGNGFKTDHQFTHSAFLDACHKRGLFVLVGFPMPVTMFQNESGPTLPSNEDWINNFTTLVKAAGQHPAVIGFIFMNEQDGTGTSYSKTKTPNDTIKQQLDYYWSQCEMIATIAKTNAPNKLCGQAFHDLPQQWTLTNAQYLNKMKNVDFWGVNTYQTSSLQSIFNKNPPAGPNDVEPLGFNNLNISKYPYIYKPVILTEIGWPATGHKNKNQADSIYYDEKTGENTANTIKKIIPQIKSYPLCLGMCYFEYCDEWWSQADPNGNPYPIYLWYGGNFVDNFPNHYWDNEGFGLYQTGKNSNIPNRVDPNNKKLGKIWPINWNTDGNGPYPYTDPITGRAPVIQALSDQFSKL
eukprot:260465_1